MNKKLLSIAVVLSWIYFVGAIPQSDSRMIKSFYLKSDMPLTADPNAKEWKSVQGVIAERGPRGDFMPGHKTEIRSRWSDNNLYLLFICHFEQLHSKPNPSTTSETPRLWDWDVAEVFIGSDFQNLKRYREFQVSPHGEWVDLDIDRNPTPPNHNMQWDSGYQVKASIDEKNKVWYGEMRIPINKIDSRKPYASHDLRINFFRLQGPPPNRKSIAWQPTNSDTYHVPEAFGRVPPFVSPVSPRRFRIWQAGVLRLAGGFTRRPGVSLLHRSVERNRVGRLRQSPFCRPAAGARLCRPLYPSRRDFQQPPARYRRR